MLNKASAWLPRRQSIHIAVVPWAAAVLGTIRIAEKDAEVRIARVKGA